MWSQARHTSEIVPARPPMTMHASPANAINRFRASPMPHGITTVAGQSDGGISSGGTMLTTKPPAFTACSAATLVAGLPQPLMTVMRSRANSAPASLARSYAVDCGSALPRTQTWGRRCESSIGGAQSTQNTKALYQAASCSCCWFFPNDRQPGSHPTLSLVVKSEKQDFGGNGVNQAGRT